MTWTRRAGVCAPLLLLLTTSGCSPTFPTTPTEAPSSLVIHYFFPFHSPLQTVNNSVVYLHAFAVGPGEVYHDVTKDVVWTVSDPSVMSARAQSGSLMSFNAIRPGAALITATWGGMSASEHFIVEETPSPRSYLEIRLIGGVSLEFPTSQARVIYRERIFPGSFRDTDVTSEAQWMSSNPTVASYAAGQVTAAHPGTTEITAFARGLSALARVSVAPRNLIQ